MRRVALATVLSCSGETTDRCIYMSRLQRYTQETSAQVSTCFYGCHLDRSAAKWRNRSIWSAPPRSVAAATKCRDLSTTHRKKPRCSGRDDSC